MKTTVYVLGYFGYVTDQRDGQTIKTRQVYSLLESRLDKDGVRLVYFDTQRLHSRIWTAFEMFWKAICCRKLVYLPAQNNLKFIFPILYFLSRVFRFEIYYVVIGGWLGNFLDENPSLVKKMHGVRRIFPENRELKEYLESHYGLKNITLLPNFRIVENRPLPRTGFSGHGPFRLVFMSRIVKEKGVDTVFSILEQLNRDEPGSVMVDFYGPVDPAYRSDFQKYLSGSTLCSYKGLLKPSDIVNVLHGYDLMVLPTFYPGEGFPGAVVEAYLAGIPVAISRWRFNAEYVSDGKSGFVVDLGEGEVNTYVRHIRELKADEDRYVGMCKTAYDMGSAYTHIQAWDILRKGMGV